MVNVEEIVKKVEEKENMTEKEKKNYEPLAFALGNLLNAIWEKNDEIKK